MSANRISCKEMDFNLAIWQIKTSLIAISELEYFTLTEVCLVTLRKNNMMEMTKDLFHIRDLSCSIGGQPSQPKLSDVTLFYNNALQ